MSEEQNKGPQIFSSDDTAKRSINREEEARGLTVEQMEQLDKQLDENLQELSNFFVKQHKFFSSKLERIISLEKTLDATEVITREKLTELLSAFAHRLDTFEIDLSTQPINMQTITDRGVLDELTGNLKGRNVASRIRAKRDLMSRSLYIGTDLYFNPKAGEEKAVLRSFLEPLVNKLEEKIIIFKKLDY